MPVQWADGFCVPLSVVDQHEEIFRLCGLDISATASMFFDKLKSGRLSVESVHNSISAENPEFIKMCQLVGGTPSYFTRICPVQS